MRFTRHRDPFEFSRVFEAFILEDPVGANVIATTLASLRAGLYPSFALGCVEDAGQRVAAVFVHTPPYPLVVACKWIDGGGTPTSLASRSRATAGVARIGPVYTPPEARKRGHAGNLMAHVTSRILSEAAVPTLFTDLANPTSNALYTRLGYVPVADATRYRLVDA